MNNNATIEFVTNTGNLTAKKISVTTNCEASKDAAFYVELNFPVDPITNFKFDDTLVISRAMKGASIVDIMRTHVQDDILVIPNKLSWSHSVYGCVRFSHIVKLTIVSYRLWLHPEKMS